MNAPADDFADLIAALQRPAAYPHPVEHVEQRETHISHVLLAGDYAYKIKKPLDLGFLDFSSPATRAHYCHEEIRLNGRLAPGIYLDVVAITGTPTAPRIGGSGAVLEHAVRMRHFDDGRRLDHELAAGRLDAALIEALGERIGRFHEEEAAAQPPNGCGTPEQILAPMRENFVQIRSALPEGAERARLDALAEWTEAQSHALRPQLEARRAGERIRECHGDMHLANMVWHEGEVAIFDGIEFNAELRWIDVASEIAFLVMDLDHKGAPALAGRALDAWLATTGDYAALGVLRLYLVYRALVRAKIHSLRAGQAPAESVAEQALAACGNHIALARRYAEANAPALLLTHGISGTGKSTGAALLVERLGAIRLRADVERKRLYPATKPAVRYSEAAHDAVHHRLEALAAQALEAGWPVIVDATFLEQRRRAPLLALAARLGVEVRILQFELPPTERDARIRARSAGGRDPSEADAAIAALQEAAREPLTAAEQTIAVDIDNSGPAPIVPALGLVQGRGLVGGA